MGLSAAVITYNEESNIVQCLESLKFCDEIVVLDSYSSDKTLELAKKYTDRVFQREFKGFSDQKTAALKLISNEWVLIVDADEIITEKLAAEILNAVNSDCYDAYRIPRLSYFLGKAIKHCGWYPNYQLRLAKLNKAYFPERLVHETLVVNGSVGTLQNNMLHYTNPNLDIYLQKMVSYSRAGAKQRFNEGRKFLITDLVIAPAATFFKDFILRGGWREGLHGFVLCMLNTASVCIRYSVLWSLYLEKQGSKASNSHLDDD